MASFSVTSCRSASVAARPAVPPAMYWFEAAGALGRGADVSGEGTGPSGTGTASALAIAASVDRSADTATASRAFMAARSAAWSRDRTPPLPGLVPEGDSLMVRLYRIAANPTVSENFFDVIKHAITPQWSG